MSITDEFNVVIAATGADGQPCFIEAGPPATINMPGIVEGAFFWACDEVAELPERIGAAPKTMSTFPGPGGSRFGIFRFPARSAGKLDVNHSTAGEVKGGAGGDASMHQTDSIDYEVILSGKVDIELPGGQVRTLRPGSLLVMGGVAHAWKNHYDEPCVYAAVVVGARPCA